MSYIFSLKEMERRASTLKQHMDELQIDFVFLHTPDNVYYISGVPLLSEWGRPMWAVITATGDGSLIGAEIEKENMEDYSWMSDVRIYGDQKNVWEASIDLVVKAIGDQTKRTSRIGIEKKYLNLDIYNYLITAFPDAEFIEISPALEKMRIIKSDEEIRLLKLGGDLSKIGANAFLNALTENNTEITIASHAVHEMNKAFAALYPEGAHSNYAYCQIGSHTLTPHLHPTGRRLKRGDIVALNVFPVIWGYCMELERTYVYGSPDSRTAEALAAVNEAFETAKSAMAPGKKLSSIDSIAGEILDRHGFSKYIRHGTGHAHGIMIGAAGREEMGELRSYNSNELAPNMINSVEPGIYLSDLGGFRHSDVMLVQEKSSVCLTEFPITLS